MNDSIFFETEFFLLVACSLVIPVGIYGFLLRKRAIARWTVLVMASCLIALSGVDVVLLQLLAQSANTTPPLLDDRLFTGELSVALYLLPAVFAGIGVNLLSHVLINHLGKAEHRFQHDHTGS